MLQSKWKIRSRYILLTIIFLVGGLTISWLFASGLLEIITLDYNAPDLEGTKQEIMRSFVGQISTWERFVDSSMFYLINFIPVLFILPTLGLFAEKKSLYVFGRHRYSSFKKAIYTDVVQYVILSSVTIVFSFLIFYSIGGIFVYPSIEDIGGFASIFPENFYKNHPYFFFVFMVCTIYFSLAIVFSLLSCALILWTDREYKVILLIMFIYLLYGKLGVYTESLWFDIFTSFTAFNTIYSTGETFVPLVILFFISLILVITGVNKTVKNLEG